MAKSWGKADYKQLLKLRENLCKLQQTDMDRFCRDVSKELAARLLALVIPRTPVGNYKIEVETVAKRDSKHHKKGDVYTKRINPTGKVGGTLRRGWTAGATDAKSYAKNLPVYREGNTYTIEVINPVEYASYVEFGHRQEPGRYVPAIGKQLKQGWVNGRYMLTISEQELRQEAPGIIARALEQELKKVFSV